MAKSTKQLRQAVKWLRDARAMHKAAESCRGFQSGKDRENMAWNMAAQACFLGGRLSKGRYLDYLADPIGLRWVVRYQVTLDS